ncbi:protein PLASTID REDOX INSENSITIVE 2, chloroplastic-like isoform X2 [Cucurbita pepo subsp. pepo]|uniref:protein PLASTID REDOX INSENSITIVE 2, chloroplastic-like isoform X2 n=1 Tax=Cucurbita pepo subsp. pepo TaxID=3664 RepID=UPI000C9D377A|nr:protein PLASTID REDOX INSENSITIVE 2, chloroplastic-like isoform X2 [Cucurbita pepo subsp. pepo]
MASYSCVLVSAIAVSPAKTTCFNGLNYPTFSPSSSSSSLVKPFVNCTLTSSIIYRATPATASCVYHDPIPEFAEVETKKFKEQLSKKLAKDRETFGNDLDSVVEVCSKIFSEYLHVEYGGPGTLLVEPFTNMFIALNERKLPGAPLAARTSLLWAQNYLDHDWNIWISKRGLK